MTNKEVIRRFTTKNCGNTANVSSNGKQLFSYYTCIAEWIGPEYLLINASKYSSTTSRHLGYLKRLLEENRSIKVSFVEHVPIGSSSLLTKV